MRLDLQAPVRRRCQPGRQAVLALAVTLATGLPAALAAPDPSTPVTTAATAAPAVPMRLSADVVPQAYALHLEVDPDQPRHRGEVEIRLLLREPVPAPGVIRLHARGLQLQQVWLEAGSQRWRGHARQVDSERVDLRFERALPAGPALLHIHFAGTQAEQDVAGLFRQRADVPPATPGQHRAGKPVEGPWGSYTQFEATYARRAFPLFDEPGWKVPWTLSLTVPEALLAVSNMPVAASKPVRPGFKRVDFQPSPPMPSYLLAFGVGRLTRVDGGVVGANQVPMGVVVPTGREADAAFALGVTGRIVERLESWFGQPHPYAKLDSLALPLTSTFDAMEHPGLITYVSDKLLASPAEQTPQFRRHHVAIAAHELAHQWFGNLVTMAWWDDLWLNESFASWLAETIANEVQPDWPWQAGLQRARAAAMRADRLASARHIEQPVLQDEDMGNLWDAITYDKGQAVLAMFEGWTGPDAFRDGVRSYLRRHAWGNATSDDFFQALAATDAALPSAVRSFTRQGGIPRLQVRLLCDDGPPRLQLAQSRLLPIGAPASPPQTWQLPLRVRTPAGGTRLLMRTPDAVLQLPDTTCPAWVQANADGLGYWRAAYAGDGLLQLAAAPGVSVAEWLALLDDAIGLHDAGDIDTRQALALVRAAAKHPSGEVAQAAAGLLQHLRPLFEPAHQAAYAAHWQAAFGTRARQLGWLPKAGDSADDRLLRPVLLPLVSTLGDDTTLRTEALGLAQGWLADRSRLPADLRQPVLTAATAADGPGSGAPLLDALANALRASTLRTERGDLLVALGHFRQAALAARARALLLEPRLDLRDSLWPLLAAQGEDTANRATALDFVLANLPVLAPRLGQDDLAYLPSLFRRSCSEGEARRLDAGLRTRMTSVTGGRLSLTRALESVRMCTAWRARQGSTVE